MSTRTICINRFNQNFRAYAMTEGGLLQHSIEGTCSMGFDLDGTNPEGSIWSERFASSKVYSPEMPEPKIKLTNMKKLIVTSLILIMISLIVLASEHFYSRHEKRQRMKPIHPLRRRKMKLIRKE